MGQQNPVVLVVPVPLPEEERRSKYPVQTTYLAFHWVVGVYNNLDVYYLIMRISSASYVAPQAIISNAFMS